MKYLEKNDPTARILAAIMGYKGNKFSVIIQPTVHTLNTYWDSGSRYTYVAIDLATMQKISLLGISPFDVGFDSNRDPVNFADIDLPVGVAMIELASFRGTESIRLYVHPDNAPMIEQEPTDGLSTVQKIVLYSVRSLKSSYGGERNFRCAEACRKTGITAKEYEAAKRELIDAKLLNKAGAITVSGKNAISNVVSWPKGEWRA